MADGGVEAEAEAEAEEGDGEGKDRTTPSRPASVGDCSKTRYILLPSLSLSLLLSLLSSSWRGASAPAVGNDHCCCLAITGEHGAMITREFSSGRAGKSVSTGVPSVTPSATLAAATPKIIDATTAMRAHAATSWCGIILFGK